MIILYAGDTIVYRNDVDDESCIVTDLVQDEEMGLSPSLSFSIYPGNAAYSTILPYKTLIKLYENDNLEFYGRVISTSTDMTGQKTVECEGALSFLMDSVIGPTFEFTETPTQFLTRLINAHNSVIQDTCKQFTIGEVTVDDADKREDFKTEGYDETINVINTALIEDKHKGYLRARFENDILYLDWIKNYNRTSQQKIKYGVNLIDLTNDQTSDDFFTVLIPLGEGNTTIASVNGGSKELSNADLVAKYGRVIRAKQWSNVTSPSTLLSEAQKYMAKSCKEIATDLDISALDLRLIGESDDGILLGDLVSVESAFHELDYTWVCKARSKNYLSPDQSSYTIGDPKDLDENSSSYRSGGGVSLSQIMSSADLENHIKRKQLAFEIEDYFKVYGARLIELTSNQLEITNNQTTMSAKLLQIDSQNAELTVKFAPFFSNTQTYQRGMIVKHDIGDGPQLFRCTPEDPHQSSVVGAFDTKNWTRIPNDAIPDHLTGIISLKVDTVDGTLTYYETQLTAQADTINTISHNLNLQSDRITANADQINLQANEISLKASKTYVDNLVADAIEAIRVDSTFFSGYSLRANTVTSNLLSTQSMNCWGAADFVGPVYIGQYQAATQNYVDSKIPDLSNYTTKTYVDNAVNALDDQFDSYATKTYVDNRIPSLAGYATQSYVDDAVNALDEQFDSYALKTYVQNYVTNALTNYATKNYVDGSVANLRTSLLSRTHSHTFNVNLERTGGSSI